MEFANALTQYLFKPNCTPVHAQRDLALALIGFALFIGLFVVTQMLRPSRIRKVMWLLYMLALAAGITMLYFYFFKQSCVY